MKKCNNCNEKYTNLQEDDKCCPKCGDILIETPDTGLDLGTANAISQSEIITGGKQVVNAGSYTINQIHQGGQSERKEPIIKIKTDVTCEVYKDGEKITIAKAGSAITSISLQTKGEHLFEFYSIDSPTRSIEYVYYVKEFEVAEFLYVDFKEGIAETSGERRQSQQRNTAAQKAKEEHNQIEQQKKSEEDRIRVQEAADHKRKQQIYAKQQQEEIAERKRQQELADYKHKQEMSELKKRKEAADLELEIERSRQKAKAEAIRIPIEPVIPISTSSKSNTKYILLCTIVIAIGAFFFLRKEEVKNIPKAMSEVIQKNVATTTTDPAKKSTTASKPKTSTVAISKSKTASTSEPKITVTQIQKVAKKAAPVPASKPKSAVELYRDGRNLAISNNYSQAIPALVKSANMGNADATYYLGMLYVNGSGVGKNTTKGFELVLKAANAGHKEAVFQAGEMYNSGTGTTKNKSQAKFWYLKAKAMRDSRAESRLRRL